MNVILLYRSNEKLSNEHHLVIAGNKQLGHRTIYIRGDIVRAQNLERALAKSKPQPGESFINSIPA